MALVSVNFYYGNFRMMKNCEAWLDALSFQSLIRLYPCNRQIWCCSESGCMGYKPEVNVKNKFIIRCLTIKFPFLFLIFWSPLTYIWKKKPSSFNFVYPKPRKNKLMVNLIFKHSFHQQMTLSVLVNWYHSAVHSSWIIFSITLSWVLHYIYVHQADIFNAPCHEDLGNKFILMTTCCVLIC